METNSRLSLYSIFCSWTELMPVRRGQCGIIKVTSAHLSCKSPWPGFLWPSLGFWTTAPRGPCLHGLSPAGPGCEADCAELRRRGSAHPWRGGRRPASDSEPCHLRNHHSHGNNLGLSMSFSLLPWSTIWRILGEKSGSTHVRSQRPCSLCPHLFSTYWAPEPGEAFSLISSNHILFQVGFKGENVGYFAS